MGALLQSGQGDRPGIYVPAGVDTVSWGWVAGPDAAPIAKVQPDEILTIDTVSHEGLLGDQGRDPVEFFGGFGVGADMVLADAAAIAASGIPHDQRRDGPHVVTGPVWVEGAEPGDVVTVEVLDLRLRVSYGVISNRHAKGALPGEMPEADPDSGAPVPLVTRFAAVAPGGGSAVVRAPSGPGLALPLRPFMGLVAVAPATGPAHSTPPGPHGGNLDVRPLGTGSRLHLPVRAEGALLQMGDPHFAQGDGEVALTALEGSLRAVVRVALRKAASPSWDLPYGETDDAWLLLGLHEDLDEAVRIATRAAVALVVERTGVDRATAYAWLSAAGDLSVSQVVDGVKGVHFSVPKAWLEAVG
ncbi:acetamidase/formamidase family protein [Acidiferrimicrobium sp. IK]|uniref:acetamidase/formamidase family protein n=1 Tax=Acidiferrimicrobium sp. IK TaxID=2871700 RepID=UPI0021CB9058|nr:acetamidase/formamidase family protein [Acidiferrimicrobium sp. IK]MCU4183182.1 acetamidase/formamidase family protein [Acidiferrimicrobium sp. IK]